MKRRAVLFLICSLPGVLLAQPGEGERRLSREDRHHLRQQMRDQWQAPAAWKESGEHPRRQWRQLPPEERQRLREEMRDHPHPPPAEGPRRHRNRRD